MELGPNLTQRPALNLDRRYKGNRLFIMFVEYLRSKYHTHKPANADAEEYKVNEPSIDDNFVTEHTKGERMCKHI